jgi:flagellar basal-body rod protein FlgB
MSAIDNYLSLHSKAMTLRAHRANILASNLVNIDTPGYTPRDLNFKDILNQTGSLKAVTPQRTHSSHLGTAAPPYQANVYERPSEQLSFDRNTVNSELERAKFADNSLRYQASVQFLNSKINGIIRTLRGE